MKRRIIISIILCIVFFWLSSRYFVLKWDLAPGHPGLNTSSFAPSKVIEVPDEEDIIVKVYPPIPGHFMGGSDENIETGLNNIKKGWIIAQYNGNCRLLFEINDADIEDFYTSPISNGKHYYYSEIIPKSRLEVIDITARLEEDKTNPFNNNKRPIYQDCCIAEEIRRYDIKSYVIPRQVIPRYAVVNIIFILIVVGINILIHKFKSRSRLKKKK